MWVEFFFLYFAEFRERERERETDRETELREGEVLGSVGSLR